MSDINFIKDVQSLTDTLEEQGLVPVDQFMQVNDEERVAVSVHAHPDANDEVIERCNVVSAMHMVDDRIEWHVGCEDTDPNEDASQWA